MKKKQKKQWFPPVPLAPESNNVGLIHTDPFGSYTGRPVDPMDRPVQDADDL